MLKDKELKISNGSTIKVELICDYCGLEFTKENRSRILGYKIIEKDACKNCTQKKRQESCMIKYGSNVASKNPDIKKKALKTKGKETKTVEEFHDEIVRLSKEQGMSIHYIAEKIGIHFESVKRYCTKLKLHFEPDNQTKIKRTMKERYGVEYSMQNSEIKKKVVSSLNQLYSDPNKKEETIRKIKDVMEQKYGTRDILNKSDRQDELQKKRRETRIKNGNEVEYNGKTAKQLAESIGINLSSFHERVRKVGLEQAVKAEKNQSCLELTLIDWLKSIDIQFKTEHYVAGKIADIYIPSHNLVIEADGLYWHCDQIIKDNNYHVKKRQLYIDSGLTPLFFRGDEINNKLEIVKSIILNKIGRSEKLNARDSNIKETNIGESKAFFNSNHLMGRGKGISFGLYHQDRLISCMQIKSTNHSLQHYEISRFCNILNTSVRGSFSRLLAAAYKSLEIKELVTFIDLRYGQGNYLDKFGFVHENTSVSFRWTNAHKTFHRMTYLNNTGYENGLAKIFDCGQAKYTRKS